MSFELWPIVARTHLIQAFKPGYSTSPEGPFRTLRLHNWATSGVSVAARRNNRAAGRFSVFSVLNVDAARFARLDNAKSAKSLATAAKHIESGKPFLALSKCLAGLSVEAIRDVVDGVMSNAKSSDIFALLNQLARSTKVARERSGISATSSEVMTGRISKAGETSVVLTADNGMQTAIPRWLARSVGREKVGDAIAIVTERMGDSQATVHAFAAIELSAEAVPRAFTPFGRDAAVYDVVRTDIRRLKGTPRPLRIVVPVAIET